MTLRRPNSRERAVAGAVLDKLRIRPTIFAAASEQFALARYSDEQDGYAKIFFETPVKLLPFSITQFGGQYFDQDGVSVQILFHIARGTLNLLECFRNDASELPENIPSLEPSDIWVDDIPGIYRRG